MSLAVAQVKSFRASSQIAEVRFNPGFEQPAHNLGEDQLALLRLYENVVHRLRIHNFSLLD
ncbi:MAG: hypothetical protein WA674_18475 [Candidatus Acidiferrales bacterium]